MSVWVCAHVGVCGLVCIQLSPTNLCNIQNVRCSFCSSLTALGKFKSVELILHRLLGVVYKQNIISTNTLAVQQNKPGLLK